MTDPRPGVPAKLSERYDIREEIGAGGMAVVFDAWDRRHERAVAVKLIRPELASASMVERFQREIAVAARLVHPHVVPVFDSGVEGETMYFVMPRLTGGTLRDRLTGTEGLAFAEVRRLAEHIGGALDYAHGFGLIHRDVKPENILYASGSFLLADFGVARSGSALGSGSATTTGAFLGTPSYASPEQLYGETELTAASDQYSFACVLFEALTGRKPFPTTNVVEIVVAHTTEAPPDVSTFRADVPPVMAAALSRALSKKPSDRFPSLAEFLAVFLANLETTVAMRAVWTPRRRAAAALLLVGSLGAGLYVGGKWGEPGPADRARSIAVLPCRNLSGDPAQDYFSEGVTEQIIAQLSAQPDLHVINMLSVMRYKGTTKDAREIGNELDADLLVLCTASRQPEGVRIGAQVVDAQTSAVLTTRDYTDASGGIHRPQLDAAQHIVQALSVTMRGQQSGRAVATVTQDSAYSLYMRGRHAWHRSTLEGLTGALNMLTQAVQQDSNFALAWAGVADVHLSFVGRWMARPQAQYSAADAAISSALRAQPSLGEALAARARLRHRRDWNFEGAAQDLRAARRANPSAWQPFLDYAKLMTVQARHEDAIALASTGLRLDPLNALNVLGLAEVLYHARRFDEALAQVDRAIELEPDFAFNHLWRAKILISLARPEDAVLAAQEAARLAQRHPGTLAILARAEADAGRPDAARRLLEEMRRAPASAYVPPTLEAVVHIGLHDTDAAVDALVRAVAERDWFISELAVHPLADGVRDDPRVRQLLAQMGLDRVPAPAATGIRKGVE